MNISVYFFSVFTATVYPHTYLGSSHTHILLYLGIWFHRASSFPEHFVVPSTFQEHHFERMHVTFLYFAYVYFQCCRFASLNIAGINSLDLDAPRITSVRYICMGYGLRCLFNGEGNSHRALGALGTGSSLGYCVHFHNACLTPGMKPVLEKVICLWSVSLRKAK